MHIKFIESDSLFQDRELRVHIFCLRDALTGDLEKFRRILGIIVGQNIVHMIERITICCRTKILVCFPQNWEMWPLLMSKIYASNVFQHSGISGACHSQS